MHCGDRAVVLHTGLDVHQDRMPPAMTIKNFLTRQRTLHWTTGDYRELANNNLVIERIALAAKATAIRRRDHTNVTGRKPEHFRERAMNVMQCLRRAPERDLSV